MKNKEWTKRVEQLNFDVRTCETNIRNLANDLTRVERQFAELWTFVYQNKGELAESPQKQTLKCNACHNWSKDYKVSQDASGYAIFVECKTCLLEKERILNEGTQED